MTLHRRAALVAAASSAMVVLTASRVAQGVYSDPALQLKSVQQHAAGDSPRLNTWMRPDYSDMARDRAEPLVWWAPGTPLLTRPLVGAGASIAAAARLVSIAALAAGAVGWALWFSSFGLPAGVVLALAALLPWERFASNALFWYSAEILVFAAVPWTLLAALAAHRRDAIAWWIPVGFLAGSLYVVKYSAAFVSLGILSWLGVRAWRVRGRAALSLCAAAASAAIPIAALTIVNRQAGSANLLTASDAGTFQWQNVAHAVALPALAAGDLDSVLRFVLMHPVHGITRNASWLSAIGLPGGVLLAALAVRRRVVGEAAALSRTVFAASVVAILGVWTIASGVSVEARHLASAGIAMLPLAIAEGAALARDSRPFRSVLATACVVYVALPLAYGPVSVVAKSARYPRDFQPAASGIYNPLFAEHDLRGVVARLERDFSAERDIWYLPEPLSALDLSGRAIVRDADFLTLADLRRDRFVTSRALQVHALLPPRFELNGKGEAIRAAFPQAVSWRRDSVPGSQYVRWIAELQPDAAH